MKKIAALCFAVALVASANAGCWWSWWVGDDKADQALRGCQLGIAAECKDMSGAQVALLWNRLEKLHAGAQVAIGYCNAKKIQNGCQAGFVNVADSASLQIGLLNFNKTGFLPFFPFFNFDKHMFGGGEK